MKISTATSPEYKPICDLTRPYNPKVEVDIIPHQDADGQFGTESFNKLSLIDGANVATKMRRLKDGEIFFCCDSDVLLNAPVEWFIEQLKDNDIIFQQDMGTACLGFYVARVSPKVIKAFDKVNEFTTKEVNCQVAFNRMISTFDLKIDYFQTKDVWNYGCLNRGLWNGEEFDFPDNVKAFHANYTIGIPNKVKLLKMAIKKYK